MVLKKHSLVAVIGLSLLLFSCSSTENETEQQVEENGINTNLPANFEVNGHIDGAVNQPLSIEAQSDRGVIQIAQTTIDQSGDFVLKGNVQGMGIYQLRLGMVDTKVIPLTIGPKDKVTLTATYGDFEKIPVWKGTKWAEPMTSYMKLYNEYANAQLKMAESMKAKPLTQEQQISAVLRFRKPLDDFAKQFMSKDPSNPANIVLSISLTPAMGFEYWDPSNLPILKKVGKAYKAAYKESPVAQSMMNQADEIERAYTDYLATKSGTKVAPEIELPNPDGKVMKLSSLRGKVVLIDFWASWCRPCRAENPNVVRLYNQYKSKGFTVFSVSLDSDASAWKRAIQADGLVWPTHVSDLKQWNTPYTQIYGFNSIPYTVLINRDGKIIGTNLRGESLEQKLKEVL